MDRPTIPAFFAGRHVLVTGATGFMGKVLVEKLLRCCPDVGRVYVVVRSKRGQTPSQRIDAIRGLPVFQPLLKQNPKAFDKIQALEGETTRIDMGLSEEDQELVREKVTVVFHLAAALDWRVTLHKAVQENVVGTKNVFDFCKTIRNLEVMEYTSTTFCQCGEEVLEERTYPPPYDPHKLIELDSLLSEDALEAITPSLYGPHPNCYTYTKGVAEALATDYAKEVPLVIVRPAIVIPTLREPIPGWVDTLNGPMGVLAASGKGVMRSMMCRGENHAEVLPADICINAIIAATYKRAMLPRNDTSVPVYNACTGSAEKTTWSEVLDMGRRKLLECPLEWTLWYPDGGIRTNWWSHTLIVFLFQTVPAYIIDFLLFLLGQERFMVRVQRKIKAGHDLLAFFTMREWNFENKLGLDSLWPSLHPSDQQTFYINNALPVDKEAYIEKAVFGCRTYALHESPSSIKYCRARMQVQMVVHRACVALFYMSIAYFALQLVGSVLLKNTDLFRRHVAVA